MSFFFLPARHTNSTKHRNTLPVNPQTDNTAICHLEQQEANALVTEIESTGLTWVNKMES